MLAGLPSIDTLMAYSQTRTLWLSLVSGAQPYRLPRSRLQDDRGFMLDRKIGFSPPLI